MTIGIVGSGAIGLTFAAALAATSEVVVLARRAETAVALARDGITVEHDAATANGAAASATVTHTSRVTATTDPGRLGGCELVLVAVKAHATAEALAPLRRALHPSALVLSLQNGIDNVAVARDTLPEARIVAGSTTQAAIRLDISRVRAVNRGRTTIARDASAAPTSDDAARALRAAGLAVEVVDDAAPLLWRKLVVNAALNPLGALTGRTNGEVVADPDLAALARGLAAETAAAAAAEGIALDDPWALVEAAANAAAANRNSMLQDLDAGRPTEIDAIAGAVVRHARAHALPAPLNETMLRLVRARERA